MSVGLDTLFSGKAHRLRRTLNGKGAADARPEIEPATKTNLKLEIGKKVILVHSK